MIILGNDASVFDDNLTLLRAYKALERRVKALEENGGGGGGSYTLPTASPTVKGGVKIGSGLQMDGEVLSVVGGATGGGKEVVVDRHNIGSPIIGASSYTEGFLIGTCIGIRVPLKNYTQALTFVNVNDETDTKTLYIQNTSYVPNITLFLQTTNGGDYDIVINDGRGQLTNPWSRQWSGSYPDDLVLFDTDAQGSATPVAQWASVRGQGANVWIGTDNNNRFYVNSVNGAITQLQTQIEDGGSWKQYKWEGSIALSDIIQTGSDASAYLVGTWLCQRDITE